MASSSDWLAAVQQAAPQSDAGTPSWMAELRDPGGFVEGAPFASSITEFGAAAQPCEQLVTPAPDPLAETFARGEEAGRAAAIDEYAALNTQQRTLRMSFRELDQAAIDSLASELCETVIALCAQALEGFSADPQQLLSRCTEAAQRLGSGQKDCALYLHPEDIELLDPESLAGWRVVADETVGRGGLRLEGADGSVSNGPADWRRAIAAAIRG